MAPLTSKQVRIRAWVTVVAVVSTFALLTLGMVYARDSLWFVVLILFIDLPAMILLSAFERLSRSHA